MAAAIATDVREGPGRSHRKVRAVAAAEVVTLDGRAGDWLRVRGGGWVFGSYFEPPDDLEEGTFLARVEAVSAPVHAGPGRQHEVVAELYRGEQVAVDEVATGWVHVRDGGWVPESAVARIDASGR